VATHFHEEFKVQLRKNALSDETTNMCYQSEMEPPSHDEDEEIMGISVGDWVMVMYDGDGQSYPGEVTYVDEKHLQVNVMQKSGRHYKWPLVKDNIFYNYENVVQRLSPPVVAGNRGQFSFPELELEHID
jgi:hypothetical protein